MESSLNEIRQMATMYVEAIIPILEKENAECKDDGMFQAGKNVMAMGYAIGVVAGKLSNCGIEGFTLLLDGIRISMIGEKRKEKMQYAVWDMNGDLHTSEEGTKVEKGGKE